jgi:hypothetical protein
VPRTSRVVVGLVAASCAIALSACSSSSDGGSGATTKATTSAATSTAASTPADTTTSPATTTDYTSLLIEASDIPVPGFEKGEPQSPPQGTGTTVAFTGEGGRTLGDTILVLPSAADAATAAASSVEAAKSSVTDAEVSDAPIGDGGTAIRGTSASGAVALLIFSQGRAVVVLEFDSDAADPVPTDVIQQVATAQSAKITSGLPD